jgi:hypothetical protein
VAGAVETPEGTFLIGVSTLCAQPALGKTSLRSPDQDAAMPVGPSDFQQLSLGPHGQRNLSLQYVLDVMHTASEAPGSSQAPRIGRQGPPQNQVGSTISGSLPGLKTSWESFLVHQLSRLRDVEDATGQDILKQYKRRKV